MLHIKVVRDSHGRKKVGPLTPADHSSAWALHPTRVGTVDLLLRSGPNRFDPVLCSGHRRRDGGLNNQSKGVLGTVA